MKKVFTMLSLCLLAALEVFSAPPTVPASNLIYTSVEGGRLTFRFTNGNGTGRLVILKAGSAITGSPVNGVQYTFNGAFGTTGTEFTGAGEYVVYRGTNNIISVSNLQHSTTYHIAVYEYNGTGVTTEYLMIALTGSQATASAPTTQAHSPSFSNIAGNTVRLSWTNGNGNNRLVLARKGAPVNAAPQDLTDYSGSTDYGNGNVLNGDNYAVYKSTGSTITINKLEPNTQYHFAIFEGSGGSTPVWLRPGALADVTTNAGPTSAASQLNLSSKEGNRITLTASGGNGSRKLFIVKKSSAVNAAPVNGTTYTANAAFGSGTQVLPGEFVVSSTTNSVTVTNLEPSSTYFVRIYDFDVDASGNTYYLTSASLQSSFSTAAPPSVQASGINFLNVNGSSMTVKFTRGNGNYCMLLMKEGSPVDVEPVDLTRYNGNGNFGSGQQLGTGNYVIVDGVNGTNINVLSLQPGKTYHLALHEFEGNNYPVYARPAATASITIPNQPTTPATGLFGNFLDGNSFRVNWVSGDGARRIVIARKGSAVTAAPTDNNTYPASVNFGEGNQIAPGQFVVYDGQNASVEVKNLEVNTNYHFAVFEYNLSSAGPDYLVSPFLSGNISTLAAPSVQSLNLNSGSITHSSAAISLTAGNGNGRIVVMKKGSPVDAEPADLSTYSASTVFGTGATTGTGNFVVQKTIASANFTVTALEANTTYHVAAFEYNGSNGPVYLRPGATHSFTTAAAPGDNTPTQPPTSLQVTAIEGNKFRLDWINGNGAGRIVVVKAGSAIQSDPVNGTTYSANASFGMGGTIGTGEFVVYSGNSSTVTVTDLLPATTYFFEIFEFNGTGAQTSYLTSGTLPGNVTTTSAPTTGSSLAVATNTASGLQLQWTVGNGTSRLVVLREEQQVTAVPANLSVYPANAAFGNGSQVAAGEYVVYSGNGNTVNITGLTPNKIYHYSIFEFNGTTGPVYNTAALTGSVLVSSTLPVVWSYFTATHENSGVRLKWGTLQEENTASFVVERNEGTGFVAIHTQQAAGNSSLPKDYQFLDNGMTQSQASYRIRQVDIDGRSSFSQVVHVQVENEQAVFRIFPNPATTSFTVVLPDNDKATLHILDAKGTRVLARTVNNNQSVDISKLTAGVYYLLVDRKGEKLSAKLVKQ